MDRRTFLTLASGTIGALAVSRRAYAKPTERINAAWYERSRRFVLLPTGKTAYVQRGHGPAALFLHGFPLNGFQWRGALGRLHKHRRCIVPDLMAMGHTETPETQTITPETQVAMLASLLDALRIDAVDLVANDSGGLIAQLFVARYPHRARTLLLTNCDVDENNPPPQFAPVVALAKKGLLVDRFIVPQLQDKQFARSPRGLGGLSYTDPENFTDEAVEACFRPLVETQLKKDQLNQFAVSKQRADSSPRQPSPMEESSTHGLGAKRPILRS
jgi:pimeloyl-ACP methyl ester carboxylesterase